MYCYILCTCVGYVRSVWCTYPPPNNIQYAKSCSKIQPPARPWILSGRILCKPSVQDLKMDRQQLKTLVIQSESLHFGVSKWNVLTAQSKKMSAVKKCFGASRAQGHFVKDLPFRRLFPLRICPDKGISLKDMPCQDAAGRQPATGLNFRAGAQTFFDCAVKRKGCTWAPHDPSGPHMTPRGPHMTPSWPHIIPNGPHMIPNRPTRAPHNPQWAPHDLQWAPHDSQLVHDPPCAPHDPQLAPYDP